MQIRIQKTRKSCIVLDFGYNTPFQSSIYWFTVTKEEFNKHGDVEYASLLFKFWKDSKFKSI